MLGKKLLRDKGFTLIEVVLYIAIISILISGVIFLAVQLIMLKSNADSMNLISSESNKLIESILYDVRNCDSINVIDSSTLELTTGSDTRKYYISEGQIYIDENESSYDFSSNLVNYIDFTVVDWTSVQSSNIVHIDFEIERGTLSEKFQISAHKR